MSEHKDEVLWENKWLKVIERDGWYTMYENKPTNGGVIVLPYCEDTQRVLVRNENCPAYGGFTDTSLTGCIEKEHTALQTAVKELKEESGIVAEESKMIPLGWYYTSKASEHKMYAFAVSVNEEDVGELEGDGTKGEEGASVKWVSIDRALSVPSAGVAFCIAKLIQRKDLITL